MKRILFPLCLALALGGCASTGSLVSRVVVSTTSASPTQAKTVDEAVKATKLVEVGIDTYATSDAASKPVLQQLKIALQALHNTLMAAEVANTSGNSAATAVGLGAFNEAMAAYNSYKSLKGIP